MRKREPPGKRSTSNARMGGFAIHAGGERGGEELLTATTQLLHSYHTVTTQLPHSYYMRKPSQDTHAC